MQNCLAARGEEREKYRIIPKVALFICHWELEEGCPGNEGVWVFIHQGMPAGQKRLPATCKMEILRMMIFPKVVLRKASKKKSQRWPTK